MASESAVLVSTYLSSVAPTPLAPILLQVLRCLSPEPLVKMSPERLTANLWWMTTPQESPAGPAAQSSIWSRLYHPHAHSCAISFVLPRLHTHLAFLRSEPNHRRLAHHIKPPSLSPNSSLPSYPVDTSSKHTTQPRGVCSKQTRGQLHCKSRDAARHSKCARQDTIAD